MCPSLSAPENGALLTTRKHHHFGDVVSFQCHIGHIMVGSASLQCTVTGTWNATLPECRPAQCVALADDVSEGLVVRRSGDASDSGQLVPFGGNISLTCNEVGRPLARTPTSSFRQVIMISTTITYKN